MSLSLIMKVLHVLAAFWYVTGIVGRGITFWQAGKIANIHTVHTLLQVSELFERWMVFPGSVVVLFFGLVTAWLQGWPIFGIFEGAATNWVLVALVLFVGTVSGAALYLMPRRKRRANVVEEARLQGNITAQLTAALNDTGVRTYRTIELMMMVIIIILMVTKPF
jgi:hypothetical protein